MDPVVFTVNAPPEPLRRHRAARRGDRVVAIDDPKNQPYADLIRWAWRDAGGVTLGHHPIELICCFILGRPKSHWRKGGELSAEGLRNERPVTTRGDISNMVKAVEDALNGLAWVDDRQIVSLDATMEWTETPDDQPRTMVLARSLTVVAPR